jgi:hypothetical protein
MDLNNSVGNKVFNAGDVFTGMPSKIKDLSNTIKVAYHGANGSLRIYQSPNGKLWSFFEQFTVTGNSFVQAGVNGNYYYIEYTNVTGVNTVTIATNLSQQIHDNFNVQLNASDIVTVSGLTFDNDGKLLVSGNGGTGGDSSASNQLTQITVATSSNLALCNRLDLIDTSTNNMEIQLDKLIFSGSNLMVRDSSVLTELQNSNLAQYAKLSLIGETTEDLLISVDGINAKLNALQIQSAKYTIEAVSQFAPDIVPQYSAAPAGIPKDAGWYYKNLVNGQVSQIYFYSYLNPAMSVAGRQFVYTLADITMSYCVVRLLAVNSAEGLVTLGIYTRPTGSGDAVPGFFKSRKVYNIPTTAKLTQGMEVMLYWGIEPNLKLHPGVARIQLQLASTTGAALGTEQLAFLSLNTDSASLAGNSEYVVSAAGFQYAAELIVNTEFSGESSEPVSAGDASSANQELQLTQSQQSNTAVCARLDKNTYTSSNLHVRDDLLKASMESQFTNINSTLGQGLFINMDTDPVVSGGVKLHGDINGNLFVYDVQSYNQLLTLTAELDGVIDDTSGALKVIGDFYQATQPVIFESPQDVNLYAGAALTHTQTGENQYSLDVNVNNSSIAVSGTFYQETQPVSIDNLSFTASDELIVYDDSTFQQLQTLNGKVVLCDTGNVVISGSVEITSATALSVTESNPITGFALETTADAIKTQTDKLTFVDIDTNTNNLKVIDVTLNTTLGQLSFLTGDDDVTDLRVRVMNTNLDIGNFPETQPVSVADPVDTHLYGFHNDDWITVKLASSGHLLVNSETQDGDGNAITSTAESGTETYTALDVKCRGTTTVDGTVSANIGSTNGSLTSTLSGIGNSVNSLDVQVQNDNSSPIITAARNSNSTQVLTNQPTVVGSVALGSSVDTNGFLYVNAIVSAASVGGSGQVFLQVSTDNSNWYSTINSVSFTTGPGSSQIITVQNPVPWRYVRLFGSAGLSISTVNAFIGMK